MLVVVLSLDDLSAIDVMAILERMDQARGGSGGLLTLPGIPGRPETDFGILFADPIDFTTFKQHLQERGVPFTEPGDLPAEIKNSFQYELFLKMGGII